MDGSCVRYDARARRQILEALDGYAAFVYTLFNRLNKPRIGFVESAYAQAQRR